MPLDIIETEEQRRRRVASRIRNEIREQVGIDLVEMARSGTFADQWTTPGELSRALEESSYWCSHRHVMAPFLSPQACEELMDQALDSLTCTHPDVWIRSGDRYKPAFRDWNAFATDKANVLAREHPDAASTILQAGSGGEYILCGRAHAARDPHAQEQITIIREQLFHAGIPEIGFGVSDDGKTWVMIVKSPDESALNNALLGAWQNEYTRAAA